MSAHYFCSSIAVGRLLEVLQGYFKIRTCWFTACIKGTHVIFMHVKAINEMSVTHQYDHSNNSIILFFNYYMYIMMTINMVIVIIIYITNWFICI